MIHKSMLSMYIYVGLLPLLSRAYVLQVFSVDCDDKQMYMYIHAYVFSIV
jgi:hypothetical protein